ncbi:flagellar hook protein FlgE [Sporomusa sp. KB1]|jgi:flagellar hook protein FlgE|uniref:flagellar hook protein FlgE n=1 Tax=Sporomusa sp. KB1 TaxID=943346 RepID=UPI0011A88A00|nr:flagellar hook-basal body complex protein [Sporomusa sp. KB1]TWH48603.1 flagellar hook protein FlgE [Sporomusa sp. KB1]
MMRALFSGVSGLKNHQTRMDVIGNNIANVNTTGFKASRVSFQDVLSQTIQGASAAQGNRGGTNPVQVGLGVGVASIDTIFTDGSYQSTGKMTDLAVTGKNLFILSDGTQEYYTRAGNFDFDGSGIYGVTGTGLKVMGWMANAAGEINATGSLTAIQIPEGTSMPPQVSTEIAIANNLSGDGKGIAAGIATADTKMNFEGTLNANTAVGEVVSFQVQTYLASGAQVPVTVNFKKTGEPGTNTWSVTTGDSTIGGQSFTVGTAMSPSTLSIDNGKGGTMTVAVDTAGIIAGATDALKGKTDLSAAANDTGIKLSGVLPADAQEGAVVETTVEVIDGNERVPYTITLTKTANTTENEWKVTKATYTDASGTVQDVTSTIAVTPVTVPATPATFIVEGVNTSTIAVNGLSLDMSGITTDAADTANAALNVYDSLGGAHKVEYTYTKTGVPGEWSVSAKVDGKNVDVTNDKIAFNSKGVLISPTSPNGGPQITVPGSAGATNFPVTMNLFSEDGTPALTQYSGKSTIMATTTDGYAAGTLKNVVANTSGELIGTFSNERTMTLAKVALATFSNPGGLEKAGSNYYVKSANSGERRIVSDGAFAPGSLEGSNVDLAEQFSDMIITQRGFQANSKDITTADEMLEIIANLKR